MTHPDHEAGQEPPTRHDPLAPGEAMPPQDPWAAPEPFAAPPIAPPPVPAPAPPLFAPGSAAVPQSRPSEPTFAPPSYEPPPSYKPSSYEPSTSYAPGYPPQAYPADYLVSTPYAPPPKRRTGTIVIVVAVIVLLCVGGSVGGGLLIARALDASAKGPIAPPLTEHTQPGQSSAPSSAPTTAPTVAPTTAQPSTEPVTTPPLSTIHFQGDLRTLLLPRPAGAVPWTDFADADGKLTLAETAKLFTDPDAVSADLSDKHFERGAVTHWSKNKVFVLIFLFQFGSKADAASYVAEQGTNGIKGYQTKGEFGLIPDSLLLVDDTADATANRSTIMLSSRGDIVNYVTVWHPGEIDLPMATAIAVSQHARLPA